MTEPIKISDGLRQLMAKHTPTALEKAFADDPTELNFVKFLAEVKERNARLEELARLEAYFPDLLGDSALASYIEARRADIKRK